MEGREMVLIEQHGVLLWLHGFCQLLYKQATSILRFAD